MSNPNKTVASQLVVLCKLAAPIILGNFAYAALGLTDTLMAGMAGTEDQAGVAIGGSFFFPSINFIIGMLSALHPVISRLRGANTPEKIPYVHAHAMLSCLIFGVVLMLLLLGLALFAIDIESSARMNDVTSQYVMWIAFTLPISALFASSRVYCEAMGDTKATLYFGFLAVLLNIPLNYIFIFGELGMPACGGVGCGIATLISMSLSTIIIFIYMRVHPLHKHYWWINNHDGVHKSALWDFMRLSLPLGISTAVETSCFTLIALILSPLGPIAVSAHTITMSMTSFVFNIPLSLGISTSIMVGYAIGQNNLKTLRYNIKAAYSAILISLCVSVTILATGRNFLPTLFSSDPAVVLLSTTLMCFAACNQVFESLQTIQAFILRGFKDTKTILLVTIVAFYCIALPIGIGLCYGVIPTPIVNLTGPKGFWIGLFCGLVTAAVLYRFRVLHHYRVLKQQMQNATPEARASTSANANANADAGSHTSSSPN